MAELAIEPATAADLDSIHRLEIAAFPSPWRREFFENEMRCSGRFNLVARRKGVVVGYLFAMWFYDEMHVNKIAVEEHQRRQGIALALMQKCSEFASRSSIRTISLEVRQSNLGAQAFYQHLGFDSLYVRPRYYPDGETAVVMMREMAS